MADKVYFKKGEQSGYDSITSKNAGTFYVTTDTHRLYLGSDLLSQSIIVVSKLTDLTSASSTYPKAAGQFYYVKDSNILCVYDSSNGWTQINPDTDTNTIVSEASVSKVTADDKSKITYTLTLNRTDKSGNKLDAVTTSFELAASDVTALATDIAVDIDASSSETNKVQLAIGGSGSDTTTTAGKVTLTGSGKTTVSTSNNTVTINTAADTHDFGSSGAVISSTVNSNSVGSVTMEADGTYLSVAGDGDDKIKYSHKTSGVTKGSYGLSADATPTYAATFNVPYVTVDAAGHITAAANHTVQMPAERTYTLSKETSSDGNDISFALNKDSTAVTKLEFPVDFTITVDGTSKTVHNLGDLGSFYSKGELDSKFIGINAMTYKGNVGDTTLASLPTSSVKIGDTYSVAADGTYGGESCSAGDILIASGTESDSTGLITGTITWNHIRTGLDHNTTYTLDASNNQLTLTGSDSNTKGNITISGGTALTATTTADSSSTATNPVKTITINHDDVLGTGTGKAGTVGDNSTITGAMSSAGTFKVPKITANAQGHITSLTEQTLTLPTIPNKNIQGTASTSTANGRIDLKDGSNTYGGIEFAAGTALTAAVTSTDGTNGDAVTVTYSHANITKSANSTKTSTLENTEGTTNKTFSALTNVVSDSQGHVTQLEVTTFTMPKRQSTYDISGAVAQTTGLATGTTGATFTNTLTPDTNGLDSGNSTNVAYTIKSSTLAVTADSTNNAATVELEWGTF